MIEWLVRETEYEVLTGLRGDAIRAALEMVDSGEPICYDPDLSRHPAAKSKE